VTVTHVPAFETRASDVLENLAVTHRRGIDVLPEVRRLAHPSLTTPEVWEVWQEFARLARERDELFQGLRHYCEFYDLEALAGYGASHQEAATQMKAQEADEAMALLRLGNIRGN
jgi:hypothetical protein